VSPQTATLLLALGVLAGTYGTIVGAGGGFVIIPAFLLLYPDDSVASSPAISLAVVLFNATSGSAAYARLRRIDYRTGVAFALATIPGPSSAPWRRTPCPAGLSTPCSASSSSPSPPISPCGRP